MSSVLLDTHAILWFWWDAPELSSTAKSYICEPSHRKLVSLVSPWEVAIKVSRKKLDIGGAFPGFFEQHMLRTYFEWLPIAIKHLNLVAELPFHHHDPFDRLLIAQSIAEDMPIISADPVFDLYGVKRIW